MTRPRRRGESLLLAAAVVSALGLAELVLRVWFTGPSLVKDPAHELILHPNPAYMPGVSGPSRLQASSLGLRAEQLTDAHAYRVLALGGSTTECAGLDTGEAWPAILEVGLSTELGRAVWVGNAGLSGVNSRHHLMQIGPLLEQVREVDAILMLIGVNDMLHGLRYEDADTDWYANGQERVRRHYEAFGVPARPRFGPLWERTELVHLLRRARQGWAYMRVATETRIGDDGRAYVAARQARAASPKVDELPDLRDARAVYRHNVERIIAIAEEHGTDVVLVTHPVLWSADLPPELEALVYLGETREALAGGERSYYSTGALARGMSEFNAETLDICADHALSCFDLAAILPSDTTVFYDDVHFNEQGARRVASALAPFVAGVLRGR